MTADRGPLGVDGDPDPNARPQSVSEADQPATIEPATTGVAPVEAAPTEPAAAPTSSDPVAAAEPEADGEPTSDLPTSDVPATAPSDGPDLVTDESAAEVGGDKAEAAVEPAIAEPTADELTADEPTADEPTGDEPTADEPTLGESTGDEPTADEPATVEGPNDEALDTEPVDAEPVDTEPVDDQAAIEEVAATAEAAVDENVVEENAVEEDAAPGALDDPTVLIAVAPVDSDDSLDGSGGTQPPAGRASHRFDAPTVVISGPPAPAPRPALDVPVDIGPDAADPTLPIGRGSVEPSSAFDVVESTGAVEASLEAGPSDTPTVAVAVPATVLVRAAVDGTAPVESGAAVVEPAPIVADAAEKPPVVAATPEKPEKPPIVPGLAGAKPPIAAGNAETQPIPVGADTAVTPTTAASSTRTSSTPASSAPASSTPPSTVDDAAVPGSSDVVAPARASKVPWRSQRGGARGPATKPAGDGESDPVALARKRARRRNIILIVVAVVMVITGSAVSAGAYYFDSVPTPAELALPEATTVYFADGKTPMAKLGSEDRTLLTFDEMNDAVKWSIVAAEDRTFWTNEGIDFRGVMRAAWNNVSGGDTQGASTITQQYARVAAKLTGVNYSRKLREAVIAWKLADNYTKPQILEFYLNTVPFGRGAYGVEAAAQAYLGKTANKNAPAQQQVTLAEAMVLMAMVKQPEPNPDDPEAMPGYDPTRGPIALSNSQGRWDYIREGLVETKVQTPAQALALQYPNTVLPYDADARQSGLDLPTGLAVRHALSELRQQDAFKDKPKGYLQDGGFRIVTTIDKRAQDAAEAAADIRRGTTPAALRGQPANWQAALVAVEPGTGRVLAYYGGPEGGGSDYAGWYYTEEGNAAGFGAHPPGSSFKVYDLAEALHQGISLQKHFDSPATKEFPASGRTKNSAAGPVRNSSTAACQPSCSLVDATVASLNVPFFDLTEKLGVGNVIEMAAKSGIDTMWANVPGELKPVRTDLRGKPGAQLAPIFSTEVGIGQYGITVLDHANGMATFAAGGKRAQAHFVKSVEKDGQQLYAENPQPTDIGLTADQIDELDAALNKVTAGNFSKDWDAAAKTGTWQAGTSTTENAHTWTVGYTRAIAAAVWVGTTDGGPLVTKDGKSDVYGANYPGPIWQQFMGAATKAMGYGKELARFHKPKITAVPTTPPRVNPTPTAVTRPSTEPSTKPTTKSTPTPSRTSHPSPTPTKKPTTKPTIIELPPPPL